MSCLSRSVVENRLKQQQAKEEGNTNLLFGLVLMGCLLFAGHTMLTHMHHVHRSLRGIFESLTKRKGIQQLGRTLAKEDVQKVAESTGNAMGFNNKENER